MSFIRFTVLIWAVLLATAAVAADHQRTKIAIAIDGDASGSRSFRFDSEDAGFDLDSLAIGESRVWTDEAGNTASIMRTTEGYEIDVAGEKIMLGELGGDAMTHADTVVEVDEVREIRMIKTGDADGVTVISSGPIDEAARQRVRDALQAAGDGGEVIFIDGGEHGAHGEKHEVRIIRKESDVAD